MEVICCDCKITRQLILHKKRGVYGILLYSPLGVVTQLENVTSTALDGVGDVTRGIRVVSFADV